MDSHSKLSAGLSNPFETTPNPFAAGWPVAPSPFAETAVLDVSLPAGSYSYALVQSGPSVNADEVEVANVASIEVMTVWDANILRVDHLTPPRSYFVGEEAEAAKNGEGGCDFFLPSDMLGAVRAPIVVADGGPARLVILPGSHGTVEIPGQGKVSLEALIATGRARPSAHVSGGHELELPAGAKARMEIGPSGLAFEVNAVVAGKRIAGGFLSQLEGAAYVYFALSLLIHLGTVASLAFFMPHMSGEDAEALDRDTLLMMQHLLNAEAEREQEEKEIPPSESASSSSEGGKTAEPAKGPSGTAGNALSRDTNKRMAFHGPSDNPDPHLAKLAALQEAATFGINNILNTAAGDPLAPTSPWGREDSLGRDSMSAIGTMFGDTIGDAYGAGGLGLSGIGEGGGGPGEGVGVGGVGTIGNGLGGDGKGGFGTGHGLGRGNHDPKPPRFRPGVPTVNGRLPAEVIQRIIRQNNGRFRACYESGLRTNPTLVGRVVVKFAIGRDGSVALSQDGGSDLPDSNVTQCVVKSFSNLTFPMPEGGIVTVIYPISLTPGE